MKRHVLITGASAGIGAALAKSFTSDRYELSLGARRVDRLQEFANIAFCDSVDVTDEASVESFLEGAIQANGPVDVLINNAGLARGVETVANADGHAWREMIETNVVGALNVTRRLLGGMMKRKRGDVVMVGSIAGREAYPGGSVYCATKRALQSICKAMRHEVLGTGVRVICVDPGMVDTEFSTVRFRGDTEKAAAVYQGTRPLVAKDVADCIQFAVERPPHVNIEELLVMPTDQAAPHAVHREPQ